MKPLEDQIRPTHIKGEAPTYIQGQGIRLGIKEGINEYTRENEESVSNTNLEKIILPPSYTSSSTIHEKEQKPNNKSYHRNLKQIFILAFDALRERKANEWHNYRTLGCSGFIEFAKTNGGNYIQSTRPNRS